MGFTTSLTTTIIIITVIFVIVSHHYLKNVDIIIHCYFCSYHY